MPYRLSAKTDLDALAIDLAPKPPSRAERIRHAGLVVGLTIATLFLTGWAVTFVGRYTKVIGSASHVRPRFEPPRTAWIPPADEVSRPSDDAPGDFDPFSGNLQWRQAYYETETGDFRPIAPVDGLLIEDASSQNILISKRDVRRGAAANAGRIHDCYRDALAVTPKMRLSVRVRFDVLPSGASAEPDLIDEGPDVMSPRFRACLTRNFSNLFYRNIGATQRVVYVLHYAPE